MQIDVMNSLAYFMRLHMIVSKIITANNCQLYTETFLYDLSSFFTARRYE